MKKKSMAKPKMAKVAKADAMMMKAKEMMMKAKEMKKMMGKKMM